MLLLANTNHMPYATIKGQITNETGEPLEDVNVYIDSLQLGSISDLMGQYELENIPLDQHEISYTRVGYISKKQTIDIRKPMYYQLDVQLKKHD